MIWVYASNFSVNRNGGYCYVDYAVAAQLYTDEFGTHLGPFTEESPSACHWIVPETYVENVG